MAIELTEEQMVLAQACAKHKELNLKIKALEEEMKSVDDKIKMAMVNQDTDTLILGIFKVTWKEISQSKFDTKKFKEDHPDMYEQYTNKSSYKRFLVD